MDLIDRVCLHARIYCPEGCHDLMPYEYANAGVELMLTLAENVANGDLSAFHTSPDPHSGKDGLDEVTEAAMMLLLDDARGAA